MGALVLLTLTGCGGPQTETSHDQPAHAEVEPPLPARLGGTAQYDEWVTTPIRLAFAPGAREITDEHREVLQQLVKDVSYRTDLIRISIDGYAFDAADEPLALQIAKERSVAVLDELLDLGLPREVFEVHGAALASPESSPRPASAEAQPEAPSTDQGERVEFRFLVRSSPPAE